MNFRSIILPHANEKVYQSGRNVVAFIQTQNFKKESIIGSPSCENCSGPQNQSHLNKYVNWIATPGYPCIMTLFETSSPQNHSAYVVMSNNTSILLEFGCLFTLFTVVFIFFEPDRSNLIKGIIKYWNDFDDVLEMLLRLNIPDRSERPRVKYVVLA